MKKAPEGGDTPKPVPPRVGAKSPTPSSPPSLRRVKPAGVLSSSPASPASSPFGSPVSTPTAGEERKVASLSLKSITESEVIPKEQINGIHASPATKEKEENESVKEKPHVAVKQVCVQNQYIWEGL